MPSFNFDEPPTGYKFDAKFSKEEEPADAAARRMRENVLFGFAVALVFCVLAYCAYVVVTGAGSPDNVKWSQTIWGAAIAALLTYLFKK
ncbi:MAG: hypothetical protein ACRC67_22655 [Inquilinus sp.]|uniref:hypothetical protein n=1 Tax=Inquilinus sp. TaxID=1932117 RepID=UPI003F36A63D